ncbi:triple gene block protein 1 [Peach chlorotic mottle virus]|uniref:Triple gene block protein 1 n=1 Tax=Peach chlorotic mottle virus TaxID=471498 RepID=A8C5N2_9VIRU|nr:triple gene block protein 1 [Peach chlorotic mottle virus]ABV58372.1 triple gene block protein 1 [Peach chlorotic mottle virus]
MDTVVSLLFEYGFERTSVPIEDKLIVHAVPGSGKTTLIREALNRNLGIEAFSFGEPDLPNIWGRYIKKAISGQKGTGSFCILDEYLSGEFGTGFDCFFSDPHQNSGDCAPAHFVGRSSQRFGRNTAGLLQSLGYSVNSAKDDELIFENVFRAELEGAVICVEKNVEDFLRWNHCEYRLPCQVRGSTFEVVTFIHELPLDQLVGPDLYIALTRHSKKIQILTN